MDNNARMARITALIADVSACQLDSVSHQENFKSISETAYGALQEYLKSKNMKTTDELVKEVIQVLPPKEQQEILNRLKELTPPTGIKFFLQPSELAKFMLYGYLSSGVVKMATPYFYKAKSWYISARSNALLNVTRSGQALTAEDRALLDLSPAERQTLLEGIEGERAELGVILEKQFGVPMSGEEALIGNAERMQTRLVDIEKAAQAIRNVEAAEAEAVSAAAKFTIWTKVFIVVNVVAIIGLVVYDKVKQHQIADELHETIAKVATARLYARMAERMELTHTDQVSTINLLAQAFSDDDADAKAFVLKNFAKTVDKSLKNITEDTTYQMLATQDKSSHADTREDPSLDNMKQRRAAEADAPLAK